jgi:hypothetical protein
MKTPFVILILLIGLVSCKTKTQVEKLSYPSRTNYSDSLCYTMSCKAIDDINNGKFKIYEFGIVSSLDTNVIILSKLNIELIYGGCNVIEGIDCYRAIMDSIIRLKFSDDILDSVSNGFDRIRFKDEFFSLWDSSIYSNNIKIVTQILNDITDLSVGKVSIQMMIDKNGKPINFKRFKGFENKNDSIIISRLSKENFEPLTIGTDKVNSIMIIPITIK